MSLPYEELDLSEFEALISQSKSAILCGNGLSINFDNRLRMSSLGETLYHAHSAWKEHSSYKVVSNTAHKNGLKSNYSAAKRMLNKISSKEELTEFFQSAITFSIQLTESSNVIKWLKDHKFNSNLVFGISQLDILHEIIAQEKSEGVLFVNYEYWSLVVYFIMVLTYAPTDIFTLDTNNRFVSAVLAGSQYKMQKNNSEITSSAVILDSMINGVSVYLRFLFSINIFLDGDSINVTQLSNWDTLDVAKTKEFFAPFENLLTTNYDLLMERITDREVKHLHGEYSKDEKVVLHQSMSLLMGLNKYDLSTITVGDYFTEKTFLMTTAQMAAGRGPNTPMLFYSKILEELFASHRTETFVIFGLCADNDYHIIRDLQCKMGLHKIDNANIVFCYYDKYAKDGFLKVYEKCITYSPELSDFAKNNIRLTLIDSKEILNKYFTHVAH